MNASIKATAGVLSGRMESFWKEEGQKEVLHGTNRYFLHFVKSPDKWPGIDQSTPRRTCIKVLFIFT